MTPPPDPASALAVILLVVTLSYTFACWIWPFKACRRCGGTGRRRSPSGRARRLCRACNATGLRLRAGRWAYNLLRRRWDGAR